MIKLFDVYGVEYPTTSFKFPGGELQVRVPDVRDHEDVVIFAQVCSSDDFMELLLVTDAIRRQAPDMQIGLMLPYLPYARQDRVGVEGEALSLKVMCNIINDQLYEIVEVWDVHSRVATALIDRCVNVPCVDWVEKIADKNTVLVIPDDGAFERVMACAKRLGCQTIQARKHRDPKTGEITGTTIDDIDTIPYADRYLMVDDICDGGRTFIEIAKVLRPPLSTSRIRPEATIELFVTHGIFSKGLDVFDGVIDKLYCANLFPSVVTPDDRVIKVDLL